MQKGIAVSLKYQHDHIEDSVLIYNPHECIVYLVAEEIEHENSFVKLEFSRARSIRSARTDCSPAVGIYPEKVGESFIVELTESKWPLEAHNLYSYSGTKYQPNMRHFVVSNHDIFHEILAESFTEKLVSQGNPEHEHIKSYFS
jgi:hypothetical protein